MPWQVRAIDHDGAHAQAEREKCMTHRNEHALPADFPGREQKTNAFHEMPGCHRVGHGHQQQGQQGRHQKTHGFFQSVFDTAGDDNHGHHHKYGMPCQQSFRVGHECAEDVVDAVRGHADELAAAGSEYIGKRPARDDTVIGKNQKTCDYPHPAQHDPALTASFFFGQRVHGIDRALTAATSNHGLCHHDGDTNQGYTKQVNNNKSTATVFTGDIGEFPDIAKADGRTGCRENKDQPA